MGEGPKRKDSRGMLAKGSGRGTVAIVTGIEVYVWVVFFREVEEDILGREREIRCRYSLQFCNLGSLQLGLVYSYDKYEGCCVIGEGEGLCLQGGGRWRGAFRRRTPVSIGGIRAALTISLSLISLAYPTEMYLDGYYYCSTPKQIHD
jgi:hypothetical protein